MDWTGYSAYSITLRTGRGIFLGYDSPCTKFLNFFESACLRRTKLSYLFAIEMYDDDLPAMGKDAHFQGCLLTKGAPLTKHNLSEIKKELLSFFPKFTEAQKKHALKIIPHDDPMGLMGYCLKTRYNDPYFRSDHVYTNLPFGIDSRFTQEVKDYYSKFISPVPNIPKCLI